MKKIVFCLLLAFAAAPVFAQGCYWVFFTDKQGTSFDPYSYFDAKAIERYQQCGADLYDISNHPLNAAYVSQTVTLATEEVGGSRWLNAVAVVASPAQIAQIEQLPFVLRTQALAENMQVARYDESADPVLAMLADGNQPVLADQLLRMQGNLFREQGIDGKGIRIAVLDGGFPRVDTHEAFQHLRDNHRILDTWNFPNRKANVYGWNSHGLSTLSCITGIVGGQQIGLATGAEFLLYRTEVETEPFKEEVWWQMAMERADQHGANLISSSLGYGKERHYTYEMDGRSYVAKAAVMAARKGILVCNSAGNEGDDKQWKTIITPADADSVLCVGGIESSLKNYRHISFSSYGPAADGRLKPDVSAYGHAIAAAKSGDSAVSWVYGTSFSCPLTAGFAACAWQSMREKTAMQMLREIQQSGDLYPYYDYALGYGVPQASHFVGPKTAVEPTFQFVETADSIEVRFLNPAAAHTIFYNRQASSGHLVRYASHTIDASGSATGMCFPKGAIGADRLNVWLDGYAQSYQGQLRPQDTGTYEFYGVLVSSDGAQDQVVYYRSDDMLKPIQWGSNARYRFDCYFTLGSIIRTQSSEHALDSWSPATHIGLRVMRAFGKSYCLGLGLDYGATSYVFAADQVNDLDRLFNIGTKGVEEKYYESGEFSLELFQRVRFVPGGLLSKGFHWDLGAYVGIANNAYIVEFDEVQYADGAISQFHNPEFADNSRVNFGVITRLTYDIVGIYARYRLTNIFTRWDLNPSDPTHFTMNLPRLEVGLQINL